MSLTPPDRTGAAAGRPWPTSPPRPACHERWFRSSSTASPEPARRPSNGCWRSPRNRLPARFRGATAGARPEPDARRADGRPAAVRSRVGHRHLSGRRRARLRGAALGEPSRSPGIGPHRGTSEPPLWRVDPAGSGSTRRYLTDLAERVPVVVVGRRLRARPGLRPSERTTPKAFGWRSTTSSTSATATSTMSTAGTIPVQRTAGAHIARPCAAIGLSARARRDLRRPQRSGGNESRRVQCSPKSGCPPRCSQATIAVRSACSTCSPGRASTCRASCR